MQAHFRRTSTFLALTLACGGADLVAQDGVNSYYTSLSDSIIHLPRGDSVELQAAGPLVVADQPKPGLMITYFPFLPISDTLAVHAAALELFKQLRPHFVGDPPFVGMRAVDVRAADRLKGGQYKMRTYGVMIVHRADGFWYEYGAAAPVPNE